MTGRPGEQVARTAASALAVVLTLSCLGPLFSPGGGWVAPCLAAVAVAAFCGSVGRALPRPAVTGVVVTLLGCAGLVTAVAAPAGATLGVVPDGDTIHTLRVLVSAGFDDIRSYAPPVSASPGLVLLATAGVFAVAVAVDVFAVGMDRPALAGIPLLGLLAVPASFRPHGLGVLHLVLALAGWLLLLGVSGRERLARWGRPLGRGQGRAPLLGGATGRVAAAGLAGAFVVPALVPALHGGIIHSHASCCGGGQISVVEPLVTVDQRLQQHANQLLLRVASASPQYLRFTALDDFDGNAFRLAPSQAAPGRVSGTLRQGTPGITDEVNQLAVESDISVTPNLAERYLPLPYSPVAIQVAGTWQLTPNLRTVFSTRDTTAGLSFRVESLVPNPTKAQLVQGYEPDQTPAAVASVLQADLALPPSVPPVLYRDADRVTAGSQTAYDKLVRLERWFTDPSGGFRYTLTPDPVLPSGAAGITSFLRNKQGFCEQFATVFTLMARHLGLPARVAVGFTPGHREPGTTISDVTTGDAHAWPEVWFTGVGWVRFEPTPRADLGAQPAYLANPAKAPAPAASVPAQAPVTVPKATLPREDRPTRSNATGSLTPVHGGRPDPYLILALIGVAVIALGPAAARAQRRRRRFMAAGREPLLPGVVDQLWQELMETADDLGAVMSPSYTARATGRELAALVASGPGVASFAESTRLHARITPAGVPAATTAPGLPSAAGAAPAGAEVLGMGAGSRPGGRSTTVVAAESAELALAALRRVVLAEEQARYAAPGRWVQGGDLRADTRVVRTAMVRRAGGGARARAALAPRSSLRRLRSLIRRVGRRVRPGA